MSNICSKCGNSLTPGAKFCPDCGAPVPETPARVCAACKTPLPEGVRFCPECGAAIGQAPENNPSPAPRTTAPEPPRMEPVSLTETFPRPAAPKAGSFVPQQPAPQAAPKAGSFMPQQPAPKAAPKAGSFMPQQPAPQAAPMPQVQQPPLQANALKPEQGPGFIPPVGPKKSKAGLIIGIIGAFIGVAGITLAILFGTGVLGGKSDKGDEPEEPDETLTYVYTEPAETDDPEPVDTETETEEDESEMKAKNIKFDLREGISVTYATHNNSGDTPYTGKLSVDDVTRSALGEYQLEWAEENDMGDLSGYECVVVNLTYTFAPDSDDEEGPTVSYVVADYYGTEMSFDTKSFFKDSDGGNCRFFSVLINGRKKVVYYWTYLENEDKSDEDETVWSISLEFYMPKNYDGVVIGFMDSQVEDLETSSDFFKSYKKTDYHFFRIK